MTDLIENTFFGASSGIFENARNLRHRLTAAEKILWEKIRNRKLRGLKFRRQHPIKKYIADFYCAEYKVVIELDGGIHNNSEVKDNDQVRTHDLEKSGICVIRFTNEEVMGDVCGVLKRIEDIIFKRG